MPDDNTILFFDPTAEPDVQPLPTDEKVYGLDAERRPMVKFDMPTHDDAKPIIKVVGVGGSGGNAVNYMYRQRVEHVSFVVCNTDADALKSSPVPIHLKLGEGLGAGNNPALGRQKALESLDPIREMLSDGTRMLFITAGLGGGTGTGAAPVIAREAKEMGILTVAIVTIPFSHEGRSKVANALQGLEDLSTCVDALIVICNDRLIEHYHDAEWRQGFIEADKTLCNAATSIVELVYRTGHLNVDFEDVTAVLRGGRNAVISSATAEGPGRVGKAIQAAINTPLLNNTELATARRILLNVAFSQTDAPLQMEEFGELTDYLNSYSYATWSKIGIREVSADLGQAVKVTILASDFAATADTNAAEDTVEAVNSPRLQQLIDHYYPSRKGEHSFYIYAFDEETLDDDAIIQRVASLPTYLRKSDAQAIIAGLHKRTVNLQ